MNVVHVIPYDGIGGVETAARSLPAGTHNGMEFHKCFIAGNGDGVDLPPFEHHGPRRSQNNIVNYVAAIRYIRSLKLDLVIGSLWRSCLILIALRLLGTPPKQVVFLHFPKSVHLADYVCNRIAMALATEIWADSEATLTMRVPPRLQKRARVISFLTRRIPATPIRLPKPSFIYWGRLDPQKGLERALRLFAAVREKLPDATFSIIGPDSGHGRIVRDVCRSLALDDAVRFHGPKVWDEIQRVASDHSFYLQTSVLEGMAMSVIEAMQLGLVPIVTPVGEIARYCTDGQNAILVQDDERAAQDILEVMANPVTYIRLARAAQSHWQGLPSYRDSVLHACSEIAEAGT